MTRDGIRIDRRTMLRATGATAVATAAAGCLGVLGSDNGVDEVVLDPPENWERRKDLDLPYPTYGEEIPSVTVPAPLQDRTVTTTEFVGERHTMFTFIYTSCKTVCPGLTSSLRHVQADSVENGYAEDFAFLPTTFDPEQDTADALRSYGADLGVNYEAGNWYFLRPETPADAKDIVEDTFGVAYESGEGGHDGEMTHFQHASLVLLINENGVVERAYNGGPPGPDEAIEDAQAVVEGW